MNNIFFNICYFYLNIKYIIKKYIHILNFGKNNEYWNIYVTDNKVYRMYFKFKFFRKYFTIQQLLDLKIFTIEDFNKSLEPNDINIVSSYSSFFSFLVFINDDPTNFFSKKPNTSEDIKKLLEIEGIDINSSTRSGKSLLIIALENENFDIVKKILDKNPDLSIIYDDGRRKNTALTFYLWSDKNDEEISNKLINKDSSEQIYNGYNVKQSPLYIAAEVSDVDKFKLLLENGADPNFQNEDDNSILYTLLDSFYYCKIEKNYYLYLEKINELFKYEVIINEKCLKLIKKFSEEKKFLLDKIIESYSGLYIVLRSFYYCEIKEKYDLHLEEINEFFHGGAKINKQCLELINKFHQDKKSSLKEIIECENTEYWYDLPLII
jgi:hypothetical protein